MNAPTETRVGTITEDGVARITIRRPEAKNALTKSMYAAIRDAVTMAEADNDVSVIILEGSGGAFAVGGDLKEMLEGLEGDDPSKVLDYERYIPFEAIRAAAKPVIAAIDGLCVGGGLTMALMCDIVIASDRSRFGIPEAKVGIVDGHMPRLLREAVPPARLRYWMYTGALFSAAEAHDVGLTTRVVAADDLEATIARTVAELKGSSLKAIQHLKRIFNEVRPLSEMTDAYLTMLQPEVLARLRGFAKK